MMAFDETPTDPTRHFLQDTFRLPQGDPAKMAQDRDR
jgi:hypothetical protein